MISFELRLAPMVTEGFRRILIEWLEPLDGRFPAETPESGSDNDPLLAEAWQDGLLEAQREDFQALLKLLRHKNFGRQPIPLREPEAEAILRALTSLRLWLRAEPLKKLPDHLLETGEEPEIPLDLEGTRAYATYQFLARLQLLLISQLDPESLEIPEEYDEE
ncbi:MAG: hypothetical protein ACOCVG_00265 [Verrucomicrobiota bacterium]